MVNSGPPDDGKHIGGPGKLSYHALERGVELVSMPFIKRKSILEFSHLFLLELIRVVGDAVLFTFGRLGMAESRETTALTTVTPPASTRYPFRL
jgi:hypothetical protein